MIKKERRYEVLNIIKESKKPISGMKLAKLTGVSRQVIVQDIALLRAENYDIFSTTKGYLYEKPKKFTRIFTTCHNDNQIKDELDIIVDLGGVIEDVFIDHEAYGNLKATLNINSRKKVKDLIEKIDKGQSTPLKNLTNGKHYHTVSAENIEILDLIEKELKEKGYIC